MTSKIFYHKELAKLKTLSQLTGDYGYVRTLGHVPAGNLPVELPIMGFSLGSSDPHAPLLAIIAGIHGLEWVGSQIASTVLEKHLHLLHWDTLQQHAFKHLRVVVIPMANPWGLYMGKRDNAHGIDLMRNAPVEAQITSPYPLLSGQRLSSRLPWYRGPRPRPSSTDLSIDDQLNAMALECQLISRFLLQEMNTRPFIISVDIHSGFGIRDRLWFPFAHSRSPFPHLATILRLKEIMDETLPHHIYTIEPQSHQYTTHGDLWDYLFLCAQKTSPQSLYIPLSLEIGSWRWIRKNPWQIASFLGFFNPIKPHRLRRALRRHLAFFDLLTRATLSWQNWAVWEDARKKAHMENSAMKLWYGKAQNL